MPSTDLTSAVWQVDADDFPAADSPDAQSEFLLRYAILAPSSHNSQPWRFRVDGREVAVGADESRWLEAADPDRRELYVSVGCAVENLRVAAEHFGFAPRVEYRDPGDSDHVATVTLDGDGTDDGEPAAPRPAAPLDALTTRVTSHEVFDGRPLDDAARETFRAAVRDDDVALHLVDDSETKAAVGALQAEADRRRMDDPAYRRELGHWIGLGALGGSWLAARVGQAVVTHLDVGDREARRNSKLVESAPVVAVLTTDADDPVARVRTGEAFERVALLASDAGVAVHPMSQTLERSGTRTRLARLLPDAAGVPQHLFRLGYADRSPDHTPRWPLETFLDAA
jgi:nitroreductase